MAALSRAVTAAAAFGLLLGLVPLAALAQPPGRQTDGTIQSIADNTVVLLDGASFSITATTRVTQVHYGAPSDLVPGRFVSISARSGPAGVLEAAVVGIFPESATASEGQREMIETRFCEPGCRPRDLMTNAVINEASLDVVSGGELTVTFAGQTGTVILGPDTRVEIQRVGSMDDLVSGANVLGFLNDERVATSVWVYVD